MSANKTASKHTKVDNYLKSPRYNYASQQTLADRDVEAKLTEKIHKLKAALKAAERHNQQLHAKLKHYRTQNNQQIPILNEQIRSQKRKLDQIQKQHEEELSRLKLKKQQELRSLSAGKISNDSRGRDLQVQIKTKQMKIVQLEGIIKDLNIKIETKDDQIAKLSKRIEVFKLEKIDDEASRLNKLQDKLQSKVSQSHETQRENIRLKQSLKDSLKKLEKANSQVYEHTQRNKKLQQQIKQQRKLVDSLQKQNISLRQISDKLKTEALERVNLVRKLEKHILELQFRQKRESQKLSSLSQQHQKIQEEFKSLLGEFQATSAKYQDLMTDHYDLQRDFERELHTIVKELTRRHIVSKTLTNLQREPEGHHHHELS